MLITREAWSDENDEMPEVVDRAIKLLRKQGGDVMIRVTQTGKLAVRRGAVRAG